MADDPPADRLESLLAEIQATNRLLAEQGKKIDSLLAKSGNASPAQGAAPAIADDRDLDGEWGNPAVRKDPKRWTGDSYVGRSYAECPPDYLEMLADLLDWMAGKAAEKNEMTSGGKPRADFLRRDAARARGWSRRNASGYTAPRRAAPALRPAPAVGDGEMPDEDIPF